MQVKDIMRTHFISLQADDTLHYIVKIFRQKHINSAPVFDNREFIGLVSDLLIAKYFKPKEFKFLWMKNKPTPIEELKKTIASDIVKKPQFTLSPNQEILQVIGKIITAVSCIPVIENKKVVGIIRSSDITKFFLKEFAKEESEKALANHDISPDSVVGTELDKVLSIVERDGKVSARKVAKELGISLKTVEKLGESLHKHHLVDMKYSFFGGAEFRRIEHGRG